MDPLAGPGLAPLELPPAPAPDAAAEPAGFLVAADAATRIHFLDWDAVAGRPAARPPGAPGILLVHGLAQTAHAWAPVARRLRASARTIAMDLRGHGLSDAPTDGYDRDTLAGDAIAVAEGAGLLPYADEPSAGSLVVAGLGYGAIVAAWTARALGGRCAGLVLVDGGWEDLEATTGMAPGEWLDEIEEPPEVLASMAAWLADREGFDPASWDADQERAARSQVVETAAGRLKPVARPHVVAGSVRAMWRYDPECVLPGVAAHIVALVARDPDGSRALALRRVARRRADAGMPPMRAGTLPARAHNLPRYEPEVVASSVLAAAASCGAAAGRAAGSTAGGSFGGPPVGS